MNYREIFATSLKALIKNRGSSVSAVARDLGLTQQGLSLLVNAKRSPSFEVFCGIADYFNVSADYLLGRTDNPEVNQ